jgi:hypothetical protein
MMAGMDEPNPYKSPKADLSPRKRLQWLPKNQSLLQSLLATMFWLMVLQDNMAGHQHFFRWFCAIMLTWAATRTIIRERRIRWDSSANAETLAD